MTFRVVGSLPINVSSGYFVPGSTGVELTEQEQATLLRAGAVEAEEEARPAPRRSRTSGAADVGSVEE